MKTTKITIATGNTYSAKEYLKKCGFEWCSGQWIFSGEFNQQEWNDKYLNPTYIGRKAARMCEGVRFEVREMCK